MVVVSLKQCPPRSARSSPSEEERFFPVSGRGHDFTLQGFVCLIDSHAVFFLNCHFEGNTRTLRSLGSCLSCDFDNPHGFSPTFLATKDIRRCQEIANGTAGIAIAGNYTES